jgi:uncharacterized protein
MKSQIVDMFIEKLLVGDSIERLISSVPQHGLDDVGSKGRTLLMAAVVKGDLDAVQFLVRNGASPNAYGAQGMTPLHEAAAEGQPEIAKYLIEQRADKNSTTEWGGTPLMCAAAWGHFELVRLLVETGGDISSVDKSGSTASDIAREKGNDAIADFIARK